MPKTTIAVRSARLSSLRRSGLLLALAGAVASCSVGPDYQKPMLDVPEQWSGGKDAQPSKPPELSHWWTRLGDPLLNDLIDEAVAGNLSVATAKAKIREARATYHQAGGALLPSVTGSASSTRTGYGSTSADAISTNKGAAYNQFKAGFDASWELDLFGANRRAVEAAQYGLDASEENLRATLLTLVGDIAADYVQARGYQARIALARSTAASQAETARITHVKFAAGTTSAVDDANATGQAATTEATIPTLEAAYAQTVHSLSVLTGRPPAALDERLAKGAPIPVPELPLPAGIPADILQTRPDVRLAERQYAQSTAKIGQAEVARYPSVSLTGSLRTSATQFGDLGKSSSIGWSFGPALTVPIFNGGKLEAAVEIAEAQRDQYFVTYRSAVLTALKDVEDAIVAFTRESSRTHALDLSVSSYRQSAALSRALYQAGSSGFLDVLTAERSLYTADDSRIQSQVLIATDYIALNKALGGGWDGSIDASKPEVVDGSTGPHFAAASEASTPGQPEN